MSKKRTLMWREAHVHGRFRCGFAWQVHGVLHLVKGALCSISKNDGRRGAFQEDLERCISRGRGCILEHQIFSLLRWFCVTGAVLRMTCNFPCLKEVSQNCFVFDVVNVEKWGSLAELFCFWRGQVQKLRNSRRIAAFLMLPRSKTEELSQNSFVFKRAGRQIDR